MGKLQHKRKPNNQHSTKISSQQTNRIRNPPRNDPFTRKKTQRKILENNQQKNQRTPKKRERPTRLLVPRSNTNPKQLATSLTSKAQFQKSAEQQSDLQKQPST